MRNFRQSSKSVYWAVVNSVTSWRRQTPKMPEVLPEYCRSAWFLWTRTCGRYNLLPATKSSLSPRSWIRLQAPQTSRQTIFVCCYFHRNAYGNIDDDNDCYSFFIVIGINSSRLLDCLLVEGYISLMPLFDYYWQAHKHIAIDCVIPKRLIVGFKSLSAIVFI